MIYIVGTRHEIQHGDDVEAEKDSIEGYYKFLKQIISDKNLTVLAEEASMDSLKEYCVPKTQLEYIANEQKKCGRYCTYIRCDPGKKESKKRGVRRRYEIIKKYKIDDTKLTHDLVWKINAEMAPYDCLREKIWLEKIKPYVTQNMLFVCGYMHCQTFAKLLAENNYKAEITEIIV